MDNMEKKMNDVKTQMEKGMRSIKYTAKYGIGFKVPNPIVRSKKEESIDVLMKRLYVMPLPKGNGGVVAGAANFDDDEDGEEEDDEEGGEYISSLRSGTRSPLNLSNASSQGGGEGGGKISSGFERSFSKGLSSVSDGSSSSALGSPSAAGGKSPAAGGGKKAAAAVDDDEGGEEGGEEDEDDGFGAMNISAGRIPTEDTALTRFIRRAIVNNGEAAQISNLKNMDWVSMPRSEEEILATLDKRFYEQDFDPAQHMLESFPAQVEDFNAYVEKQLSEKDIAKEHILAELATRVEANYHALIEGMKNVQEVDLDLTAAGVQTVECRRKLSVADHKMMDPLMQILHKRIRRENMQKVANVVKGAHAVMLLEKEAKDASSAGRYERAVMAATDAKLAIDSEVLKNVSMMDGVSLSLEKMLPDLRLQVDKCLRRLCSGKVPAGTPAGGAAAFLSTEYSWILRAYLTLDDHGVRLSSKPRSSVNNSPLYVEGAEPEDSLAQGITPIAPTVDRGGIPGLSERIQRFTAMELDYCIKSPIIAALMVANATRSPSTTNVATSGASTMSITSTASMAAAALAAGGGSKPVRSASPPVGPSARGPATMTPSSQVPQQQQQQQQSLSPPPPEVVRDVNGRIIAYKGKRLSAWLVQDLVKQLPAGTAVGVLGKIAQLVTEVLHRYFLLMQWHRSPFDAQNAEEAFLHRAVDLLSKQKSDLGGGLSDEEDEDDDDEEEEGSPKSTKKKGAVSSPSKAAVAARSGNEEDEDSSDDDNDITISPTSNDSNLDPAEKARLLKERKAHLEKARLAAVARGLKQVRKQLWAPVEKAVVALLHDEDVALETLIQMLATGELLVALGEDFGRNDSATLKALLKAKCEKLLEKTHQECFGVIRQMLDRETWYNVPISVEDLGGMAGVVNNHIRSVAWPSMNGWGKVVKDRMLRGGIKAGTLALSSPALLPTTPSILCNFVSMGNPFLPSPSSSSSSSNSSNSNTKLDPALVIFDPLAALPASTLTSQAPGATTTTGPLSLSTPGAGPRSPGGGVGTITSGLPPLVPKPPPVWSITQAALNGFAKYTGRYLQLMHLCPAIALETYTSLLQLLDFYIYMVFAIFVPEQSVQLFLTHSSHLNRETSVVEEMSWASHELHVPLPCEEEELAQLKSYLNRVREDLIEVEHWGVTMGVEAANKMKKLGADAAKKFSALAASSATTTMMMGGGGVGGLRVSPPPNSGPGSLATATTANPSLAPSPVAGSTPARGGAGGEDSDEDSSEGEEEEGAERKALKSASRRMIKKVPFKRPAFIAETLEDADSLYGLSQRAVAVESCFFIVEILKSLEPNVLGVLPKKASLFGGRGSCDAYLTNVSEVLSQLRIFTYRCAAHRLIGAAGVIQSIEAQHWNQTEIFEEANAYTDEICGTCRELWTKIHGAAEQQQGGGGGLDSTYIPLQVQLPIWTELTQAVMAALLEGFARIERCSTEGRSLMSMDLQAVQSGLDEVQKVRPTRGKVYVDNYIKAFYYGEGDVMAWIEQNHKSYFFRHLAGLLNAGVGQKKKKGLRELIVKVAALYAPVGGEEEEDEEETGAVGGRGSPFGGLGGGGGASRGGTTAASPASSTTSTSSGSTFRMPTSSSHMPSISSTFSNMMHGKGFK